MNILDSLPQNKKSSWRDMVPTMVQHVIEKESQRHKWNYDHKIRCTQLRVSDQVPLKRTAFKGKHKIQDHWEDMVYHVDRQPYRGLPIFNIIPVTGGKVKISSMKPLTPIWR